jgi:hypothetical protein
VQDGVMDVIERDAFGAPEEGIRRLDLSFRAFYPV